LTLRIVAPPAGKRTTLEEHRRADAGSVMDGVFLDIENRARNVIH
jgi:hypothetical protein